MKSLVILCEGAHDDWFMYHILKSIGFSNYSKTIKNLPYPFKDYMISEINGVVIDELKTDEVRPAVPIFMENTGSFEDVLIVIYNTRGETKTKKAKQLIDLIKASVNPNEDIISFDSGLISVSKASCLFIRDSDTRGIKKTEKKIINDYIEVFPQIVELSQQQIVCIGNINVGMYIFSDEDGFGRLENILIPLMKMGNEKLFDETESFLSINKQFVKYKEQEHGKSVINIAGQFVKAGKSNAVIIKESGYLNDDKIKTNLKAIEISTLCTSLINHLK